MNIAKTLKLPDSDIANYLPAKAFTAVGKCFTLPTFCPPYLRPYLPPYLQLSTESRKFLLTCAAVALIVFLRSYNAYLFPTLFFEDGTQIYAYYLNNTEINSIFRFYGGYSSLLPNLLGYLSVTLLPTMAPYILALLSLAISSIALSIFTLRRFRYLVPCDKTRMAAVFILALMPIGDVALKSSLMYSLWNIYWITLLISIVPLPTGKKALSFQCIFQVLSIWSHPLSITLMPIYLRNLITRRTVRDYLVNLLSAASIATYWIYGVRFKKSILNCFTYDNFLETWRYSTQRVFVETIVGNKTRYMLNASDNQFLLNLLSLVIVALVIWCIYALRETFHMKWQYVTLMLLSGIYYLTFFVVIGRSLAIKNYFGLFEQRYFYVQQLALGLILASCIGHCLLLICERRHSCGNRDTREDTRENDSSNDQAYCRAPFLLNNRRRLIQCSIASITVGYLAFLNITNSNLFYTQPETGIAISDYVQQVNTELRKEPSQRSKEELVFNRGGKWDIKVRLQTGK